MRRAKRLAVLVTSTMLLAVLAIPAGANHEGTFEVSVDGTATLNEFKTVLTLTGKYTCSPPTEGPFDPDHSGIGGRVVQEQKGGKYIVQGWIGMEEDMICDNTERTWSAHVEARVDNVNAVWKRGRVIATGGGNSCDFECDDFAGDEFARSIKITH